MEVILAEIFFTDLRSAPVRFARESLENPDIPDIISLGADRDNGETSCFISTSRQDREWKATINPKRQ